MVIDSSAVLAILLQESDAEMYANAIEGAELPLISAATFLESAIVVSGRKGPAGMADLESIVSDGGIWIEPLDEAQARTAYDAWRTFGRGNHPAKLNLGDCFAYALAKTKGRPLLFKGKDFGLTDLASALD